jgi:hypothetical protein
MLKSKATVIASLLSKDKIPFSKRFILMHTYRITRNAIRTKIGNIEMTSLLRKNSSRFGRSEVRKSSELSKRTALVTINRERETTPKLIDREIIRADSLSIILSFVVIITNRNTAMS